eukprot:8967684-Alexandrium_andersonii.AAC.1
MRSYAPPPTRLLQVENPARRNRADAPNSPHGQSHANPERTSDDQTTRQATSTMPESQCTVSEQDANLHARAPQ